MMFNHAFSATGGLSPPTALMRELGFRDVTGVDPFIPDTLKSRGDVVVWKKHLCEIEGSFDFVMLNHSFKHMPEPVAVLCDIRRLLKPGRCALIRTPVASSFALQHYRGYWVQLDPARHLFLHTPQSMAFAAAQAGLEVESVFHDSYEFGLMSSEEHLRNSRIPAEHRHPLQPMRY